MNNNKNIKRFIEMNNNRKLNQPISLTEQDLHFLVEEAVKGYLVENGMEEDFLGGLGTIGSKLKNRATAMGQNFADNVGQKWGQAKDAMGRAANAVGQKYKQTRKAVGKGIDNIKSTYQVGSINQDAQKAVQNAIQSLNNLVQLSGKLQGMGQNAVIGPQTLPIIQQCIKTLNQVGGRFQGRRTLAVK